MVKLAPSLEVCLVANWRQTRSICELLEQSRIEMVALKELVELGTVAFREARRLGNIATGDLEHLREVFALEPPACFFEG